MTPHTSSACVSSSVPCLPTRLDASSVHAELICSLCCFFSSIGSTKNYFERGQMAADRHHLMPMWVEPARNTEMLYFNFLGNLTKIEESPKGLFLCCKVLILFQHLTLSTEQSLHPLCPCWLSKGSVLANATPATKSSAQMSLCAHCVIMDIIIQNEKTRFNHQIGPVWVISAFRWHNDAVTFI